ncbi:hypothetical protein DFH08DRAFT_901157 [Mycena albidolilacea]|uniref:Uncharacterized protein n=1 Tax=Mycena albidolilacea TaxID=1033008 RepID=A0AAD6Z5I6_9AGAR|nr:hypothetical protein DFH08DRAFT_901157 [Mycena albidolilacea]
MSKDPVPDVDADGSVPAITLQLTDIACPDPLEKIFQQVEAQNERRAQQEAVESEASDTFAPRPGTGIPRVESSENMKKGRRRGSVSISRFGQLSTSESAGATSDGSSAGGPTTPALSDIAAKSPFFQQQLKNASANGSQTSFASGGWAADDAEAHEEDHNHVTHMHTIAPKQSLSRAMGGFLPRRLSRARSTVIPSPGGGDGSMVIGVSVAAATVEVPEGEGAQVGTATVVHAPGALHHQTSKGSMSSSMMGRMGWAARAKTFAKKFRRKSRAALSDAPQA